MTGVFTAIARFSDVETRFGWIGAVAAPVLLMFMVALMSVADFGVLTPPISAGEATGQATKAVAEIAKDTEKNSLGSFFTTRNGTVETRAVLRTANSREIYWSPVRNLVFMLASALACIICGAAVSLKLVYNSLDVTNDKRAAITYQIFRHTARWSAVCCFGFTLYALWVLGFGPVLGWLWENRP